ncbi:MAG: GatB/YqeY domain-containing protein [Ignavibacteria bacterium]|jgi:uncharacterized protein YqeY
MKLKDKINEDLKTAMKNKEHVRLQTIRSIRASILEFEKSGAEKEMSTDDELKILTQAAKKRHEAIEQFRKAGREELAEKEEAELKVIQEYLPKQLTENELLEEVKNIADEIGASTKADFAKLMPVAIKALKGKADGKAVKSAVEQVLGTT